MQCLCQCAASPGHDEIEQCWFRESYTLEHVRQLQRFEARTIWRGGAKGASVKCSEAGHPEDCKDCITCHSCRCCVDVNVWTASAKGTERE